MLIDISDVFNFLTELVKSAFAFMKNLEFTVNGVTVSYYWVLLGVFVSSSVLSALFGKGSDES